MATVVPATSTLANIRNKVREITASSSESTLSTRDLDQRINVFYSQDFPYAIKMDQMRSVYEFFTAPYIDTYPIDVNNIQGIRAPLYVDGYKGYFFKDRNEFFNMWPRWPTRFQESPTSGNPLVFSFQAGSAPILRGQISMGGTDTNGNPIQIGDDGNGNLQFETPNPVVSVPSQTAVYTSPPLPTGDPLIGKPVAGMKNLNTENPGLNLKTNIGTVNYQTATFNFTIPTALASGTTLNVFVSQYQTGRPYCMLFWNNTLTIRPIPKLVHRIEIEVYLTPVQFMATTDSPILNQWWQYISYGVACELLRDRQDYDGLSNAMEGFKRQEALVLERQSIEEINQRNTTIYTAVVQGQGWNQAGSGWYP